MHISVDRPASIVWSKGSSPNDDAAFITSSTYLNDDKVSKPTRISWDTGAQDANKFVRVTAAVSGMKSVGLPVVAAFCPKTAYALPPGTVVGWTYTFAPMPNASAYSSGSTPTYSQIEYQMSQARSMLILGRIYTPSTTTINTDDLKFFAAFGRPATNGLQQMAAVKDATGLWTAGLIFETQPP